MISFITLICLLSIIGTVMSYDIIFETIIVNETKLQYYIWRILSMLLHNKMYNVGICVTLRMYCVRRYTSGFT